MQIYENGAIYCLFRLFIHGLLLFSFYYIMNTISFTSARVRTHGFNKLFIYEWLSLLRHSHQSNEVILEKNNVEYKPESNALTF